MENEKLCSICLVLGCIKCSKKWDVILHETNPLIKNFQNFLETHCANCGSNNHAIEIVGIQQIQ